MIYIRRDGKNFRGGSVKNRQIVLASRPGPAGPGVENFALVETELAAPTSGDVLLETLYLSLDPYMRARMYEGANYAASVPVGAPMPGATISRVISSTHKDWPEGMIVESWHGWQSHHISDGTGLRVIAPVAAPLTAHLGVLGMPGRTGYGGMLRFGQPRPGETVVVSAASGAVGSVAGQVARLKGARVVGIAGGAEKCRYLIQELGFAAAIDHRAPDWAAALASACPKGVDVYFDNVGGEIFAAIIPLLNKHARVPVCGTIAVDRNNPRIISGPDPLGALHGAILVKQLTLRGFLYDELRDLTATFHRDVSAWIRDGKLSYREQLVHGLDAAPAAFLGLFSGQNFGKLIVDFTQAKPSN